MYPVNRNQLRRVKAKAEEIAHSLRNYEDIGPLPAKAVKHHFQLRAPASLEEVEMLEKEQNIRLPEDYRAFLLEIGNGGAGPWAGLLSLNQWHSYSDSFLKEVSTGRAYLSSPSFFTADSTFTSEWSDACWEEWDPYQGTICIADCSIIAMSAVESLIVSGSERGRMVSTGELGQIPVLSPFPDFLSWYENWQDKALAKQLDAWYQEHMQQWHQYNPPPRWFW